MEKILKEKDKHGLLTKKTSKCILDVSFRNVQAKNTNKHRSFRFNWQIDALHNVLVSFCNCISYFFNYPVFFCCCYYLVSHFVFDSDFGWPDIAFWLFFSFDLFDQVVWFSLLSFELINWFNHCHFGFAVDSLVACLFFVLFLIGRMN